MARNEQDAAAKARRQRLLFRAQRRGFKEVDLIFGTFAANSLGQMSEAELDQFEALLEAPDQEVYRWFTGETAVPPEYDTEIFAQMQALCSRQNPTWNV